MKIPRLRKHTMYSEKLFLWLWSGPGSQQGAGTKSRMSPQSRDQIQAQQPLENMMFVSFSQSCFNFLSLKLAIIATKTRHWALVQIYSLAVGVCCKASALADSALAKNTYVSAINLHQGSAVDLNPYIRNWSIGRALNIGKNECGNKWE